MESENQTVVVTGLSNREFLERYAQPGRVGLSAGTTPVDIAICRAQLHLDEKERWAVWSHAFLFQGVRPDGHHWVIESDIDIHRKHIRLGVQENRVTKFHDEQLYTSLAVLDFGLNETHVTALIREGLELVAGKTRYSLRELIGTLIGLRRPELRSKENILAREYSMYCSAFVQRLFRSTGIDLAPGLDFKHTTPQDIFRTSVPHTMYILQRKSAHKKMAELRVKLRRKIPIIGR